MTQGLREIQPYDLSAELESVVLPRLRELLRSRAPGHCMRITDLDTDLMVRLCGRLRAEVPNSEVVILSDRHGTATTPELTVSSTKLVELRNPLPDGKQRAPLLVFIPNDVRAAAEDSFGVATFEQAQLGDVYGELRAQLLRELPVALRGAVVESLRRLAEGERPWTFADPVSIVRFLLTAKINGNDAEAIGAALYQLALVTRLRAARAAGQGPRPRCSQPGMRGEADLVGEVGAGPRARPWARQPGFPDPARELRGRSWTRGSARVDSAHRSRSELLEPGLQQVGVRRGRRRARFHLHQRCRSQPARDRRR